MGNGGGLMVRPGFLDDDDAETIRRDRKAVIEQKGKSKVGGFQLVWRARRLGLTYRSLS
jgi:hypothetical protein